MLLYHSKSLAAAANNNNKNKLPLMDVRDMHLQDGATSSLPQWITATIDIKKTTKVHGLSPTFPEPFHPKMPSSAEEARDDADHAERDSNDFDLAKRLLRELLDPGFIIAASQQRGVVNANEVTDDDDSTSSSIVERPVRFVDITTADHWESDDVSWFSSGTDDDDRFAATRPDATVPRLEDYALSGLMVEVSGVNVDDETDAFDPIVTLENNRDLDGGNEEIIKDKDIPLDLLEDFIFQTFYQDGDLDEKDSFDTHIGLFNLDLDESAVELNNNACELLDDVSVVTLGQEACEDDEEWTTDYFDLLVGLLNLELDENISCKMGEDVSVVTFDQEASEEEEWADYFDHFVGPFALDSHESSEELNNIACELLEDVPVVAFDL
jgi:hypothetical protein